MKPIRNAQLICVSDRPVATYSGMMPGVLAGQYEPSEMEIDLPRLSVATGARLIIDRVEEVDRAQKVLKFGGGRVLEYDVLSIGVGSQPTRSGVVFEPGHNAVPIKPMQSFLARLAERVSTLNEKPQNQPIRVAVVGAGVGGIEIAFSITHRLCAHFGRDRIRSTLIHGSSTLGGDLLPTTSSRIQSQLAKRGIEIQSGSRVEKVTPEGVELANGKVILADLVLWATGAVATDFLTNFDLAKDDKGFLSTRPTLQTIDDDSIFAVGDCGTIESDPTPKAGVYAVRQGPVLWRNLRNWIEQKSMVEYRPQRGFLKLINTADNQAIAEYKGRTFFGRWCWNLKDRIDRKFMRMYQAVRPMPMKMVEPEKEEAMRCVGCGGKVGASALKAALAGLEIPTNADVILGLDKPDDCAIIACHNNQVTVTNDFFAAPFDDPFEFGRISVLNAASDCFAIGAEPHAAIAMVQVPFGHPRGQRRELAELLAGASLELKAMGAALAGGHTIEGPRLTMGFTMLAKQLRPPLEKSGLRVGDQLILSKPIGSGVLLAAQMRCQGRASWYQAMRRSLLQSNQVALELCDLFAINSLTDVTGFGLAGHLLEMLTASRMKGRVHVETIPLFEGTAEFIERGVESTLAPENRVAEAQITAAVDVSRRPAYAALFDPQTCGGILMGVSEGEAASVLGFLNRAGFGQATIIGEVVEDAAKDEPQLLSCE